MSVEFIDNSEAVKEAMNEAITAFLHESGFTISSQTAANQRVDTGETKRSWDYRVDEGKKEVTIGSTLENAIWEEFGTGQYALKGNGRKTGWYYEDEKGEGHFTHGKRPIRPFYHAWNSIKGAVSRQLESILRDKMR